MTSRGVRKARHLCGLLLIPDAARRTCPSVIWSSGFDVRKYCGSCQQQVVCRIVCKKEVAMVCDTFLLHNLTHTTLRNRPRHLRLRLRRTRTTCPTALRTPSNRHAAAPACEPRSNSAGRVSGTSSRRPGTPPGGRQGATEMPALTNTPSTAT